MAADAAAAAALLSRPAKDLRTGSISLSLTALGEGRNILAIVAGDQKLSHAFVHVWFLLQRNVAQHHCAHAACLWIRRCSVPALSCSPSSALYATHQALFRLIQFSSRAWGLEMSVTRCHKYTLPYAHHYRLRTPSKDASYHVWCKHFDWMNDGCTCWRLAAMLHRLQTSEELFPFPHSIPIFTAPLAPRILKLVSPCHHSKAPRSMLTRSTRSAHTSCHTLSRSISYTCKHTFWWAKATERKVWHDPFFLAQNKNVASHPGASHFFSVPPDLCDSNFKALVLRFSFELRLKWLQHYAS